MILSHAFSVERRVQLRLRAIAFACNCTCFMEKGALVIKALLRVDWMWIEFLAGMLSLDLNFDRVDLQRFLSFLGH